MNDRVPMSVSTSKRSEAARPQDILTHQMIPLDLPNVFFQWGNLFEKMNFLNQLGARLSSALPSFTKFGLSKLRAISLLQYRETSNSEPSVEATKRTELAIKTFFEQTYTQIQAGCHYPLADLNKCLGFYAFAESTEKSKLKFQAAPKPKLVMIAISEDRYVEKDTLIRKSFVELLDKINAHQNTYLFKLVLPPTKEQYVVTRSLDMRIPGKASRLDTEPRARCAEPALAFAIAKAGRFIKLNSDEIAVVTVGNGVWHKKTRGTHIHGFQVTNRNIKHVHQAPLSVAINGKQAYVDRWDPCIEHCYIYQRAMQAIAASRAGGFLGDPIFDEPLAELKPRLSQP